MTDTALNYYLASGTNAARLAFTPSPPAPASGPSYSYLWYETDTTLTYAYASGAWHVVSSGGASGPLHSLSATSGNGADTTEDILDTYTLPANTLGVNGDVLEIIAHFTHANTSAGNKTFKVYFGASVFTVVYTGSGVEHFVWQIRVVRYSATTQYISLSAVGGTSAGNLASASPVNGIAGTETLTSGVVIKATGQSAAGGAGDVTLQVFVVRKL